MRISRDVRARLDRHGFRKTSSMLNEWNYGLVEPLPADMHRAAFITSSLLYMQDAPVDISALYRADNLFGPKGTTPLKTGYALIALGPHERHARATGRCREATKTVSRSRPAARRMAIPSRY